MLVVAYHLQFDDHLLPVETATTFFRRSYLFVDLFFILSGFIISYVNRADRPDPLRRDAILRFMKKRIIRLLPLILFCLGYLLMFRLVVTIVYAGRGHALPIDWSRDTVVAFFAQVTMINAWLPLPPGWNIPSWSISAELFAYLLFPLFIACRIGRPVLTWALCALFITGFYGGAAWHGSLDITIIWSPLRCLAGFLLGVGIHAIRGQIARVPTPILSALQALSLAAILAALILPVSDVCVIPGFVLLVATTWTDDGMLGRRLRARKPRTLGHWSYSVYLNHVPVIGILSFVWARVAPYAGIGGDTGRIAWIVLTFAVVLIVSRWTYTHVELPAQRYLTLRLALPGVPRNRS